MRGRFVGRPGSFATQLISFHGCNISTASVAPTGTLLSKNVAHAVIAKVWLGRLDLERPKGNPVQVVGRGVFQEHAITGLKGTNVRPELDCLKIG